MRAVVPFLIIAALAASLAGQVSDAWLEPEDRKLTAAQIDAFLDVQARVNAALKQAAAPMGSRGLRQAEGTPALQEALARHRMSAAEWRWVAGALWDAWVRYQRETLYDAATEARMRQQVAALKDELTQARAQLRAIELAQRQGKRWLPPAEAELIKAISRAEAAEKLAEAAVLDLTADEAAAEYEALREAIDLARAGDRTRLPELRLAADEVSLRQDEARSKALQARALAAMLGRRAGDPETPQSKDEQAAFKVENEKRQVALRERVASLQQGQDQLEKMLASLVRTRLDDERRVPDDNVALVRRHADRIVKLFDVAGPSTVPARP